MSNRTFATDIAALSLDEMSPIEALTKLYELKRQAQRLLNEGWAEDKFFIYQIDIQEDGSGKRNLIADRPTLVEAINLVRELGTTPTRTYYIESAHKLHNHPPMVYSIVTGETLFTQDEINWLKVIASRERMKNPIKRTEISDHGFAELGHLMKTNFVYLDAHRVFRLTDNARGQLSPMLLGMWEGEIQP